VALQVISTSSLAFRGELSNGPLAAKSRYLAVASVVRSSVPSAPNANDERQASADPSQGEQIARAATYVLGSVSCAAPYHGSAGASVPSRIVEGRHRP